VGKGRVGSAPLGSPPVSVSGRHRPIPVRRDRKRDHIEGDGQGFAQIEARRSRAARACSHAANTTYRFAAATSLITNAPRPGSTLPAAAPTSRCRGPVIAGQRKGARAGTLAGRGCRGCCSVTTMGAEGGKRVNSVWRIASQAQVQAAF